jgi:cytidylate kinase
MSVVTVRGLLGSGAPEVGRQIAEKLQADYVDREIIARVALQLHREEQEVITKEMPSSSLLGRIAEALGSSYGFAEGFDGAYLSISEMPLDDARYLQALKSVVRELARKESLVIMGRGSQFILKNYPGVLHVLVVAPLEVRVKRIMEERKLEQETARLEIARFDKSIREFFKRYFKAETEDPVYYDLVINTEHLSFQAAASTVVDALSSKARTKNK